MAAPKKTTSGNADAFDDLLGQLVDELAMTPTMVPEPEPPLLATIAMILSEKSCEAVPYSASRVDPLATIA